MDPSTRPQPPQGSSIVVDADGICRWVHECNLLTNPIILPTFIKMPECDGEG